MKVRLLLLLAACFGGLVAIIFSAPTVKTAVNETFAPKCSDSWTPKTSTKYLQQVAESITVKVIAGNSNGSGTLIRKHEHYYNVLTNQHVLTGGEPYRIQTPDGRIHRALALPIKEQLNQKDLALLKFRSDSEYQVATVAASSSKPILDEDVFAAGFPFDSNKITLNQGKVAQLSEKSLKGGYQIGYSNEIEKGMSGGPMLNRRGELIGINGMLAHPPFGNPYVFEDDSQPTDTQRQEMKRSSWGISIETLTQLFPKFIPPNLVREVNGTARKITVFIKQPNGENGSGVIIARKNDNYRVYTVLTNNHVVEAKGNYEILAPDGQCYPVKSETVQKLPGLDVGILQFTSKKSYEVATLADYDLESQESRWVFVSGWPKSKQENGSISREFSPGLLLSTKKGSFNVQNSESQTLGYELVYTNITERGMSGGPILDTKGRVIGIHGRADGVFQVQLGYSLGVPVRNFLAASKGKQYEPLNVEISPPPEETEEERELIRNALLPPEKPGNDAKETDWLNYGNRLWRLFYYKDAVEAFDKAIQINPDLAIAYYARGMALRDWGKYQEALSSFEEATQKKDKLYEAWRERSSLLLVLQRNDEALSSINRAIKLKSNDFALYLLQGEVLKTLNRYQESENAYRLAIDINSLPQAYISRGYIRSIRGNKTGAISDFDKAIEINPKSADAYLARAIFHYDNLEDVEAGEADFAKAIAIKPNYAEAYYRRGSLRYNWENYQGAIEDYNQVIAIFPEYAAAYYDRGLAYRQIGEKQKALADLNKAAELSKESENQDFYQQTVKRIEEINKTDYIVALYEGEALEKSVQSRGKIVLAISEIDSLSGKVRVRLTLSKGLTGEGELEGTKIGNVVKVSGIASTGANGGLYDLNLHFEIFSDRTIKGTYRYSPKVGHVDIKDEAEFTASQVNSN
ncbi:trypsin-like peptidase domain-containing protein [Aerosakkonema funiforme]|uniref:trypsin-like peptidase domain-containing protein n=1 Tax=Aerosakkonema funiforme TaxID=1246630 RepID=UPI0035BA8666